LTCWQAVIAGKEAGKIASLWEEQQQQQLKDGGPLFWQGRTKRYEETGLAPKGARNMMHASLTGHGGWMVHPHEHNVSVLVKMVVSC
jgi:hypothetical protein